MEREQYRAFHARRPLHKADHFVNFCVTAHSLRDYVLEHHGKLTDSERAPYHLEWSSRPLLQAVSEVANSAKHFVLRTSSGKAKILKTRRVAAAHSDFVDVYLARDEALINRFRRGPDIVIALSNGCRYDLYGFTADVVTYWRTYLRDAGFRVRRQALSALAQA